MFQIICCCHNAEEWIEKSINSIQKQTLDDFNVSLWIDKPTDKTFDIVETLIYKDNRFNLYSSNERVFAAKARWDLLKSIKETNPKDIVVLLDGDDWLYSENSLFYLQKKYDENEIVSTHGNYITSDGTTCSWSKDYSISIKKNNGFREAPWIATHLRTFKYGLIEFLNEDIIKKTSDEFFQSATDMALFLPILELSGIYSKFISEILYVYNTRNNLVNSKQRIESQKENEKIIRNKSKQFPLSKDIIFKMIGA